MKKYLYPVLAIIVVLLVIGLLVHKKNATVVTPAIAPVTDTTTPATGSKAPSYASGPLRLDPGHKASTTVLSVGQKIIVTVINPTDSGYVLDPVAYQNTILTLSSFTKAPAPANAASTGAQGTATYEFTAIKPGTTSIAITASHAGAAQMSLFTNVVSVK